MIGAAVKLKPSVDHLILCLFLYSNLYKFADFIYMLFNTSKQFLGPEGSFQSRVQTTINQRRLGKGYVKFW